MCPETHHDRGQVQREAFDAGIDDHLTKAYLHYLCDSQNESCVFTV